MSVEFLLQGAEEPEASGEPPAGTNSDPPAKLPSAKKGQRQTRTPRNWIEVGTYFNTFNRKKDAGAKTHEAFGREIWGPLKGDGDDALLQDPYINYDSRMRQIRRWVSEYRKGKAKETRGLGQARMASRVAPT